MDSSAQASTDIKKALQETVKLDDGRHGFIFTELPPIGLLSRWHCHICGRTISSERSLVMHLTHPVHTSNLRAPQHPAAHFKKFMKKSGADSKKEGDSWNTTDVVPGEPVPPGMEDSIETCHIQEAFDNYKGPLIGLEYIVELVNLEDKSEPRYICLLCEKRGDPRSVMVHVTSQNHFIKYICCFFRTVGNILNLTKITPENKRGYSIAVRKIGAEIEKHYGRLKPTSAAAETFAQKKYEILRAIDEKEHFRETPATTFTHLVTPEMLAKFNDEEEDENLKPITKPMEELKTQSSLSAMGNQKSLDKNIDRNRSTSVSGKPDVKNKEPQSNGGSKKEDPEVVVIDDDRKSMSMSPPSVRGRPRRSRERSIDRGLNDRRRSPLRRRRSRSRSRSRSRRDSPRRMADRKRDYSPDRRRGYSPDRRRLDYSPDRRNRDRRELTPDRRMRDFDDRRLREASPGRRGRDYDDRRRRELMDRDRDRRLMEPRENRDSPYNNRRRISPRPRSSERHMSLDRSSKRGDKKRDRYDEYRSELRKLEIELDEKLKQFESRPEKHPLYNEEWKAFWNKRYKEVQQQGRDPNTYDFKPEWIVYWGRRMKEINDEEFRLKSEELKRQMDMDRTKRPIISDLGASPVSSEDEREPVTVEDIKNTWKGLTGTDLSGPPMKKRSPSPRMTWEEPAPIGHIPVNRSYEVAPPVVHALRTLSVLEHYLGSLGPRAIDLMSRALVLERGGHSKSMSLLDDPEVHVFFETVREKIRGALMAYIVEKHLVNTCRIVINVIDKMLKNHPPKTNPVVSGELFKPAPAAAPVVVPGIGMVEKMAVAQQIAGALVAQGRSDVSQEELEALINAVVGIAQASNASFNANTSSINFFSQLNMKNSTADAHINKLLKHMIQGVTGKSDPVDAKPEEIFDPAKEKAEDGLKEKLSKFNSLPREEQQSLIAILKDLEKTDPKKVETLRKYVTVGSVVKREDTPEAPANENFKTTSNDDTNQPQEKQPQEAKSDDEDDDDYSFEDVYKAASEKLKTNKKLTPQRSVEQNSDSNISRASLSNPLPTVSEKAKLSDFSNVFGPQRNPAEKTAEPAANAFKIAPKNSAPEVSDPNSQMSLDEDVMIADSASSFLPKSTPTAAIPGLGNSDSGAKPAPGFGSNTIDYGFIVNPEHSQSSFQHDSYSNGPMDSYGSQETFRGNNEPSNFGRSHGMPPFSSGNQGYSDGTFGNSSGPYGGKRGPGGPPGGNTGPFGGGGGGGPFGGNRGAGGPFGGNNSPYGSNSGPGPFGGHSGLGGSFGGNSGQYGNYGGNYGDSHGGNFGPGGNRGGPGQFNPGNFSDSRSNYPSRSGAQGNPPPDSQKYFPDSSRYFPRNF